jgi:hypothetical protein
MITYQQNAKEKKPLQFFLILFLKREKSRVSLVSGSEGICVKLCIVKV